MLRGWCLLLVMLVLAACAPASAAALGGRPPARAIGAEPVQLWQDGAIFKLIGALIGHARNRVLVEVYEIGRPDLLQQLAAAHVRGADVRVITDPTVPASRDSLDRLQASGVPALFYPVDDGAHQIDHVKLLIADGEAAVGGMNWGLHSDRNHDFVLATRMAPALARLADVFEQDWALAEGRPTPLPPSSGQIAQTAPGEEIRNLLESGLASVQHRALAEVYTLTDPDVLAQLAAAKRRGADVRVLLDPNQPYNLRSFEVLAAAGVLVRWYPIPRGALLHAKIGLFDSMLLLGSANWTYSGLDVNHELDIETGDPAAVNDYGGRFESDWARSAGRSA